jgi:hypothetical protein
MACLLLLHYQIIENKEYKNIKRKSTPGAKNFILCYTICLNNIIVKWSGKY